MKKYLQKLTALILSALCVFNAGCAAGALDESGTSDEAPASIEPAAPAGVVISEAMSSNKATLALPDGSFPDWIELHNLSAEPAALEGCALRCGKSVWPLPGGTLEPGEYRLVPCSRTPSPDGDAWHASFAVSKGGEKLALLGPGGEPLDEVELPALESDTSWARGEDGRFSLCLRPTPGFENSEEGLLSFQESLAAPHDSLAISEVMSYNEWHLPVPGELETLYFDWVEVTNFSKSTLRLQDYYLSDSAGEPRAYRLPEGELGPGESALILCGEGSGEAPFALDSGGDTLYLTHRDGTLSDYVAFGKIPLGCSYGREKGKNGFFFFAEPSPGEKNSGGVRFTGEKPQAIQPDGVFDGVESVRVDLTAPGLIRYTLDGSVPTADSPLYTGPITLRSTCVVRAVSFEDGHLPSAPLSLSYILNEEHSLPVVSIVCEPSDLFDLPDGIYANPTLRTEKPGSVMFYDGEERFSIDCGVKLHGATSRTEQAKKSFKLCFRDRYEGRLEHDLFSNGVLEFKSILVRAAQEGAFTTLLRDSLLHRLSMEAFPGLPAQDSRFAVLYLNGQYWGVYDIREAHSTTHYAQHYGCDEDTVSQWKQAWPYDSLPDEIYREAMEVPVWDDEVYQAVCGHFDMDSVIAWYVMQAYSGNFDMHSPNMRFYYTEEDQMLRFALVDLDFGMFRNLELSSLLYLSYAYTQMLTRLLTNAAFRERLLSTFAETMAGPLSEEHVLALLDSLADELRPEMARDYARWGLPVQQWENSIESVREYFQREGGRPKVVVLLLRRSGLFPTAELDQYFPPEE